MIKKIISIAMLLVMLFSLSACNTGTNDLQDRISELESQIGDLQDRISELESQIGDLQDKIAELEKELENSKVKKEYIFEAEYIDLRGLWGLSGWGDSIYEWMFVAGNGPDLTPQASNGYYLAYFYRTWLTFTFEFTSAKAFDAPLIFALFSELGNQWPMEPKNVQLHINGTEIDYTPFKIAGNEAGPVDGFYEYKFTTAASQNMFFKAGKNTVSLTVTRNGLFPERPESEHLSAGPAIDYMKIITKENIVFNSYVDKRGLNKAEKSKS